MYKHIVLCVIVYIYVSTHVFICVHCTCTYVSCCIRPNVHVMTVCVRMCARLYECMNLSKYMYIPGLIRMYLRMYTYVCIYI